MAEKPIYCVLNGKRYKIIKVPPSRLKCKNLPKGWRKLGDCDHPKTKNKTIRIDNTLTGKEELEVLCHEISHGQLPYLDEETVEGIGLDFSDVLWRMGYRKIK